MGEDIPLLIEFASSTSLPRSRPSWIGGMRFVGSEEGRLVFVRIRELFPEDQLSPARSHKMLLDPQWVTTISVDGRPVWPAGQTGERI